MKVYYAIIQADHAVGTSSGISVDDDIDIADMKKQLQTVLGQTPEHLISIWRWVDPNFTVDPGSVVQLEPDQLDFTDTNKLVELYAHQRVADSNLYGGETLLVRISSAPEQEPARGAFPSFLQFRSS